MDFKAGFTSDPYFYINYNEFLYYNNFTLFKDIM